MKYAKKKELIKFHLKHRISMKLYIQANKSALGFKIEHIKGTDLRKLYFYIQVFSF
jgi:hypothetical protein